MKSPRNRQQPVFPGSASDRSDRRKNMGETDIRMQQQGQQKHQGVGTRRLAVSELQTVKWVASQGVVRRAHNTLTPRYLALKRTTLLGWFIVVYEALAVWWWTFLHNLPWPQVLLALLDGTDSRVVAVLDLTQQRVEWWWDASGVRLMWLRESVLTILDNYLTKIDAILLRVQDTIISAITYLLKPIVRLYRMVVPDTKREAVNSTTWSQRRDENESDINDDDDTEFGESYHSDASTDSRRMLKGGSRGGSCGHQYTTDMAEGRFREAMYHRVKKELRIMRKNSIRFSCGIVTYARQMVVPRVQPYADSFQVSYQKWAREHEIQEMLRPLQEEWNTNRPPIAKMLSLAQALCVVCLAFLLRLAKGKKSRRTRSMRSESLRRRSQNLTCSNSNQLSLSPKALQQSSEPTPSHHLVVPESLQERALKEDDEYLDGSPAKDSALGSEDNRSDQLDSDHAISPIDEGHDSDEDAATAVPTGVNTPTATAVNIPITTTVNTPTATAVKIPITTTVNTPTATAVNTTTTTATTTTEHTNDTGTRSKYSSPVPTKEEGQVSPKQKNRVTIMTPQVTKNNSHHNGYKKGSKFNKKVTTII